MFSCLSTGSPTKCQCIKMGQTKLTCCRFFSHLTKVMLPQQPCLTSVISQFILSSFLKGWALDSGKVARCPRLVLSVFCLFKQGSSNVKSSSAAAASFFTRNPACDDPSPAQSSVPWASDTINDTLYKREFENKIELRQEIKKWNAKSH